MKASQFTFATLRQTPSDADVISAQLMLRAGLIRKLASGLYVWLPMGLRVLKRVEKIVREEKLTTLMITHNMEDAINHGDRLIMLHQGQIVLDVAGEEKNNLTVMGLLDMFQRASGDHSASDSLLI